MTREESIEVLKLVDENASCDDCLYYAQMEDCPTDEDCIIRQALDMAIQALSQEPSDELVSRDAVLEAVSEGCQELRGVYGRCEELINELPSVTQKSGKWIKRTDRLPEDKTYVLTTIKVPNRVAHARSGWYECGFFHNDNGDTWRATDMEVKAWMPLPEPYEPQEGANE